MKTALITGANRGLGYETARQLTGRGFRVIATARDPEKGQKAVDQLNVNGGDSVRFLQLDLLDETHFAKAAAFVEKQYGHLDVLVNNAGIISDAEGTATVKKQDVQRLLETNFYAPLLLSQQLIPLLRKSKEGRIINVSSGMGALEQSAGGYAAYRLSKTALNGVSNFMANDLASSNIKVVSVCPGWVRTDMGGPSAHRSPEEGASGIVWLATAPSIETGRFYRDGAVIGW